MLEKVEIYKIKYNHRNGNGFTFIAVRNVDDLPLACAEFENKYSQLGYKVCNISFSYKRMTPILFTKL